MRSPLDLSVVVPAHNERDALPVLHEELRRALDPTGLSYELIFVDDGSDDGSFALLEGMKRSDGRLRVIRLRRNYGQTAALDAGFRLARGARIASIDADGENDPQDLPALLSRLDEGFDVVCGWRGSRRDATFSRRLPSLLANKIIGLWTGVPAHDCGCTLRAYHPSVVRSLALYSEMHRLLPAVAHLSGARVTELPVSHRARRGGRSHYGLSRAWKVLVDLCALLLVSRVAAGPARWLSAFAIPFFALGLFAVAAAAREVGFLAFLAPLLAGGGGGGFARHAPHALRAAHAAPMVAAACALSLLFLAVYLALSGILGEALLEGSEPESRRDRVERLA